MLPAPPIALRICTLLCLLLATVMVPASSHNITFSAGDTVALRCPETDTTGNLTLITWRKEDGSHSLHYVSDGNRSVSNFTDPRISFQIDQRPPVLQIRDARPDDAGNYTCNITVNASGRFYTSWMLHISENIEKSSYAHIYIASAVAGFIVILVVISGIIYCKFCTKDNTIPSQIHQTSPENTEKEEPVYDNAHEDYFLRFNTLYDRMPSDYNARRLNNP